MDYSNYLTLYSGGADSTYFIEREKSARYLIHFEGRNAEQTKVALVNSNLLERHMTIVKNDVGLVGAMRDGETNAIHALYDTEMALHASITAVSFGLKGIVMCFNGDDMGIEVGAIEQIMRKVEPDFKLLVPLKSTSRADIKSALEHSELHYISCMHSDNCGFCAKCIREGKSAKRFAVTSEALVSDRV